MTTELLFATNNAHKVSELQMVCPPELKLLSLNEVGINIAIDEPYHTLEENAQEKCRVINKLTNKNCFAEDSGLFIEALNGEPGVQSAIYAGENNDSVANINKVLTNLNGITNRKAYFKTVCCTYWNGEYYWHDGICEGIITQQAIGTNGFGYDAIFIPTGYNNTFAEMDKQLKVNISHRKKAFDKFIIFLLDNIITTSNPIRF